MVAVSQSLFPSPSSSSSSSSSLPLFLSPTLHLVRMCACCLHSAFCFPSEIRPKAVLSRVQILFYFIPSCSPSSCFPRSLDSAGFLLFSFGAVYSWNKPQRRHNQKIMPPWHSRVWRVEPVAGPTPPSFASLEPRRGSQQSEAATQLALGSDPLSWLTCSHKTFPGDQESLARGRPSKGACKEHTRV